MILDCGHAPSPHSSISTGIARDREGKTYCYECAAITDREAIECGDDIYAYVSSDGKRIITWAGIELMRVTHNGTAHSGFHFTVMHYIRAIAPNGKTYYGKNGGNGMAIRLKANKGQNK